MPLNGVVLSAVPATGFDCSVKLTASQCQAFLQAGFQFVVRYLSRSSESPSDLSSAEAQGILDAGLSLMAVQHVAAEGWVPTQALGQQYGGAAAQNAEAVGFPAGVNVWLDLEGIAAGTSADDVIAYCNAWFAEVAAAGYLPGLYVGANCVLNGTQLYHSLSCRQYWKSGSTVPMVVTRGFCMVQTISDSFVLDGVSYDRDVTQADNLGGTAFWLAPLPPAANNIS